MNDSSIPVWVVVLCFALGVALIASGLPLLLRRVKPNWVYGVRFPATLADETVWYEINARGGRHMVVLGVVYLVLLSLALSVGRTWPVAIRLLVPIAALMAALLVDAVQLWRAASRLLEQRRSR